MSSFFSSSSKSLESQPTHNPDLNSIYDVFLSSNSEDYEESYTSHLCSGLQKAGIFVFWDERNSLSGDDQISETLLQQVIENSRIYVVVLSTGYANSKRCLELLEQIIEFSRIAGRFILPVFLGVDPDDVLNQKDEFGKAFGDLAKRVSDKDTVESWKIAFARICEIQPYHWGHGSRRSSRDYHVAVDVAENWSDDDNNIIKEHVELAISLLNRKDLFVAEYQVGGYRAYLIPLLLDPKPKGVLVLGIWGMVGIGKTTLAKAIYNQNGDNFEGKSFLPNIRKLWKQDTRRVNLQERLLSDILLSNTKINSIKIGKKALKKRLSHKRILLVLDDVNKLEQLDALCGSREWFGPGSMIIITTRDRRLLRNVDAVGVDHVHEMKEMDEKESYELFNWYAFNQSTSKQDFDQLSENAVAHAGRLPLALEVLGSKVFRSLNSYSAIEKVLKRWSNDLNDIEKDILSESPHPVIQKVLKRCINDLNDIEKDIFLDIACFLIGMDQEEVIDTLIAFGDLAKVGIKALEDQCFITIDQMNKLGMHVLLRDTGREIIHEQMRVEFHPWIYDVFLSFRGEDTSFTSHLHTRLSNAGIHVFNNDHEFRLGDQISISRLQAIRRCRISVVVLSRHYASSRWHLQELENIMECYRRIGQLVVPVFYGVDPYDVLKQTGAFGKAFHNLLKRFSVETDKENRWRIALREIGCMAGVVIIDPRNESEDIKNVSEHVTHFLDISVVEHPVGIETRVQDVIQLLNCTKSKDAVLLGIWGMGGSGKTTLAKAVYNKLGRKYKCRSFLQNISVVWKQDNGQVYLLEKLLSDTKEQTKIKVDDIKSGKEILFERLCSERVLLVLDDVDKSEQLNTLYGDREWFGSNSIIIITTRDKRLLEELQVDHVCRMKIMDESESAMLFCWHAFNQPNPQEDYVGLFRDVVAYCGGLPLALEVLGRELFGKDKTKWRVLERYKRIPHPTIQTVLKRSFDSLSDDRMKNIFLEVACFFIGLDQAEVIQKLNGFGDLAATCVPVLVDRSLVTVDEMNKLGMHALLRDVGRKIFCERLPMQSLPRIFDVFLSFNKDTSSLFTSCLIESLETAGISVYKDDNSLSRDDNISSSLLQVIQRCRIFIVVLSIGYAGSRRCLQVLEQITECHRIAGQFVLPVYLNEDSFVAEFEFREAFYDLTNEILDKDEVESWKIAFARISQIRSFKFYCKVKDYWSDDDNDINRVVELARDLLDKRNLFVVEFPVGIKSRVQNATQLITHQKSKDVLLLGIWGMVGIGKTIIAKAIYNQYGGDFEGRSYLPNIREVWELDKTRVYLQERLLSDIYNLPKIKIGSIEFGKKMLKEKLCHKKVLLVLDDVNKLEQLNALCESREWFGPGSMVIITTRDRRLLRMHGVEHVYNMEEMNENESCELFSQYFNLRTLQKNYDQLYRSVVAYAGRLPLALEVLGSNRIFVNPNGVLASLMESPLHPILRKILKRCINDLNNLEKSIFLDIACFLNGMDREEVIQTLIAFGDLAKDGVKALEDQCLITIDKMNKLRMHVLLQDTGREIIREQMLGKLEPWIYDVFLSFRGEDTRATFTSHLNTYLANAGIYVFMDDDKVRRGDWISISLLQAIKRSRIFVVILSRHYANSRWCLQELENIIVCCETYGRVVVPVFYGIDPSEVRNQTCEFGEAFQDLLNRYSVERDKEMSWRRALRKISGIAGIVIKDSRNESKDINEIVEQITSLLDLTVFSVAQHPVGVNSRVEHVIELLKCQQSKDVLLVGISGIGGIGKTTIAKAVYNQIHCDFEGCCFLPDIREVWERSTSQFYLLQERVLSDIYGTSKIKIKNIDSGKIILQQRLCHKKVLLILDDVDKLPQLRALCSSRDWFGPGSRIIITTRYDHLLKVLEVDHIFRMSEMDNDESIEHFSWHAFKQQSPKEDLLEISEKMVAYCGGLPLAHEVIGSYLFGKGITEWKRVLKKLKIIPNHEVHKKLKISFDGLDDNVQKEIFLDIAFFFIGMDQNDVAHILNGCGLYVGDGISDLVGRNLITVDNKNKLGMHHLLRDMGKEIIREQTPEPEERSRLWFHEEVLDVLRKQKE